MRDFEIRTALRRRMEAQYAGEPDTLIIDELGLMYGSSRVDLAVVNGRLCGYEIKSDHDTLRRLSRQQEIYNGVFDRVTLVTGSKFANSAPESIPAWWAFEQAVQTAEGVGFVEIREGKPNPAVKPLDLARLLWRDEALEVLERHGGCRGLRGKPRDFLHRELSQRLALEDLGREVRQKLKSRTSWRPDALRT